MVSRKKPAQMNLAGAKEKGPKIQGKVGINKIRTQDPGKGWDK